VPEPRWRHARVGQGACEIALPVAKPDNSTIELAENREKVLLGCNVLQGEKVQFVVPAYTWQAGSLLPGGRYALFGCMMAPGFSGSGFEAAIAEELIAQYPDRAIDIIRLRVNRHETRMPKGFAG